MDTIASSLHTQFLSSFHFSVLAFKCGFSSVQFSTSAGCTFFTSLSSSSSPLNELPCRHCAFFRRCTGSAYRFRAGTIVVANVVEGTFVRTAFPDDATSASRCTIARIGVSGRGTAPCPKQHASGFVVIVVQLSSGRLHVLMVAHRLQRVDQHSATNPVLLPFVLPQREHVRLRTRWPDADQKQQNTNSQQHR